MNKLTEIKERLDGIKQRGTGLGAYAARQYFHEFAEEDITYLISLLEEKDKALAFYGDKKSYQMNDEQYEIFMDGGFAVYPVMEDGGNIARKALNTSSNQEGETR